MDHGFQWRSRQSKHLSPLSSCVRSLPRTQVKRVSQRSAESLWFSSGAPPSPKEKVGEVRQDKHS